LPKFYKRKWSNALTLQPPSICFQSWTIDKVMEMKWGTIKHFVAKFMGNYKIVIVFNKSSTFFSWKVKKKFKLYKFKHIRIKDLYLYNVKCINITSKVVPYKIMTNTRQPWLWQQLFLLTYIHKMIETNLD
jgi:hypothetical protein